MLLAAVTAISLFPVLPSVAHADETSAPAILQWFEGSYSTIERRTVDAFVAGYGSVWLPPPGRADSGNQSVGYDQYNRFDLGSAGNPTLYGTETGLKALTAAFHTAGDNVYVDLVWNHDGFRNSGTSGFAAQGGYPGFVLSYPGTSDGDFHSAYATGDQDERLSGLIDIDHSQNIRYIRNPVNPGDPNNIPAGTVANKPTATNARFYPVITGTPARTLQDPATGAYNIPVYDFTSDNTAANPIGTPVEENALGYLMRNAQWLVQDIGVDGFRLDATKNYPAWVLNYYDRAVYKTSTRTLLNGQQQDVFAFGEYYDSSYDAIQSTIRKDINPATPNTVGGNRDALDFPQFFALKSNLSNNGLQNDWRNVVNSSIDLNLDGTANGSQGVSFVSSHDNTGADLSNVAYAYTLLRPGNANVYFNGHEFGANRDFPQDGRGDALGGQFGTVVTNLVDIRLRYSEGNYNNLLTEKETLIVERADSLLAGYSNRGDSGYDSRTVHTSFKPGTPLIELTGNASDTSLDPNDNIPALLVVQPNGDVNMRVPRNGNGNSAGKGYVIYGPATPQGNVTLSNVAKTLAPDAATADTNGTARTSSISVIKSNSFTVSLQTTQVNLLGFYRDPDADGDNALLKLDGGLDLNNNGHVDNTTPNTVAYGFETFSQSSPLYAANGVGGTGLFTQSIDTTTLSEGMHYLEVRAFRHRDSDEPAVFSSWRMGIYIDRFKPNSIVQSLAPTVTGHNENQTATIQSTDLTANNVHILLDLPSSLTDAQVLAMIGSSTQATQTDRDLWTRNLTGLTSGNHVLTVVSFEQDGNSNVQRYPGFSVSSTYGAGLGDLDFNGAYTPADISRFATLLASNGSQFNPAADLSGDGLINFTDLSLLGARLTAVHASSDTLTAYNALVTSVPEPTSSFLLIPLAALSLRRRRN